MAITVGMAGITGKFARCVVPQLLKHSDITIRGYCRDPSKVPGAISSLDKATLFKGDAFDKDAVHIFAQGCDVLICCYLGDEKLMIDGQKILIAACEDLHVARYIASDWALDYTKLKQNPVDVYSYMPLFFYYYWINGQTLVDPELDNAKYPEIKPVSWEDYMKQWPLEQLPTSYFALNA